MKQRISLILALYAGIAVLVLGTLSSMVELYQQFYAETSNLKMTAQSLQNSYKPTVRTAIYNLDGNMARDVVAGVTAYDYIVAASIIDESGIVLASYRKENDPDVWRPLGRINESLIVDIDIRGEQGTGQFLIELDSEKGLATFYELAVGRIIAEFLKYFLLAIVIFYVGSRRITGPLIALSEYLKDTQPGNPQTSPPPGTTDPSEIGDLARNVQQF